MYPYNLLNPSVTSTSRALLLVVHIRLSPHTDTIYGDVSVSNTSRSLTPVRIAPFYSYRNVNPSQLTTAHEDGMVSTVDATPAHCGRPC